MDEIRGISDGAGLDFESLSTFILIYPFMMKAPGCTSFAVNQDGSTWVGRNYDMYYWLKKDLEIYYTAPNGGYRSLGQTDIMVGREDGVNEKGLYAALHGIPSGFVPGFTSGSASGTSWTGAELLRRLWTTWRRPSPTVDTRSC